MERIAIRNRYDSTTPQAVHANGVADSRIWHIIRDQFFATAGKFSPTSDHAQEQDWQKELTVITWNTGQKPGAMELSCKVLGIPHKTIKADVKNTRPNTRITYPIKIEATVEALPSVQTPYCLFVDSWDLIFLDSPAKLFDTYKRHFGPDKIVFGAERGHFPGKMDTYEAERELAVSGCAEGKTEPGITQRIDRPFLNAGFQLGKTADLIELYREAKSIGDSWAFNCLLTDQAVHKKLYASRWGGNIVLDHNCRLVQNLFGVQRGELELLYVNNGLRLETV
jgi:hypothetical protein